MDYLNDTLAISNIDITVWRPRLPYYVDAGVLLAQESWFKRAKLRMKSEEERCSFGFPRRSGVQSSEFGIDGSKIKSSSFFLKESCDFYNFHLYERVESESALSRVRKCARGRVSRARARSNASRA